MIHEMEFHDFPTIYGILKQNHVVEETADKFYAGSLALLRIKARQFPSHAIAVEHNRTACEWDWVRSISQAVRLCSTAMAWLGKAALIRRRAREPA